MNQFVVLQATLLNGSGSAARGSTVHKLERWKESVFGMHGICNYDNEELPATLP